MKLKRVVVTGLGALTPIGNNVQEFWKGLLQGKSGANLITYFDTTHFKTKFACELKGFDPLNYMDKKEARKTDIFCQYALITAGEAIKDAELNLDTLDKNKVGVIWASGIGGLNSFETQVKGYVEGQYKPRFSPFFITQMITDMSAGLISIKYGFRGVNFATVSACSSSTHALIEASHYIRLGKANIVIAGGSEAPITEAGVGGFSSMKALSTRNDAPEVASRPFDQDREGFVPGEGGGALILEEMEHALERGATIYGELVGGGATADAYHMTATHPEGLGAALAMEEALNEARLIPAEVDYLNAHATSTQVGDISELNAIQKVFGDNLKDLQVSATKSMTGHLLGGAGAIEAVATVMTLREQKIPPTINHFQRDAAIPADLNLTPNQSIDKKVDVAMSNTFGFGGHNAIVLFKKFEE